MDTSRYECVSLAHGISSVATFEPVAVNALISDRRLLSVSVPLVPEKPKLTCWGGCLRAGFCGSVQICMISAISGKFLCASLEMQPGAATCDSWPECTCIQNRFT